MQGPRLTFAVVIVSIACFSLALAFAPAKKDKPKPAKVPYATIAPIMKNCSMCHQGAQPKNGLDLTSYSKLMKGDKEGKVVIPGKPASSRLSKAVHRKGATPMPPMKPLPAKDVAKIDAWIKAGARP